MRFLRPVAYAAAALMAALFVFGPATLWVIGVRTEAFENRPLAERPDVEAGWNALEQVAPWATDHLPGRQPAVWVNGWMDYHLFGRLPRTAEADPDKAPTVVRGKNGQLFLGEDFDSACADPPVFRRYLRQLRQLAVMIEASGRRVVWSVGPNKSAVATDSLPTVVPRGACAARGLDRMNHILDAEQDPRFVNVRRELAERHARGERVFWKTDTHWNPAGSAHYARQIAETLDPDLAERIELEAGESTAVRDLIKLVGLDFPETSPTLDVRTGATVTPRPGSAAVDHDVPHYGISRWTASPSRAAWPGTTVLIGDSFTYYALGNLRPLFADGTFLWTGHVPTTRMVQCIVDADTVVLEVVQRSLAGYVLARPDFRRQVATALAAKPPAR